MIDILLQKLSKRHRNIHLGDMERVALWEKISATIANTEPSPYTTIASSYSYRISIREYIATILILGILVSGGSIAAAAENALPTSALYPIKLNVTEPARKIVLLTPAARARWEITRVERRFDEARTLVLKQETSKKTNVDKEVGTKLAKKITEHVAAAQFEIDEISRTDTVEGTIVAIELKNSVDEKIESLSIAANLYEDKELTQTVSTRTTIQAEQSTSTEAQLLIEPIVTTAQTLKTETQNTITKIAQKNLTEKQNKTSIKETVIAYDQFDFDSLSQNIADKITATQKIELLLKEQPTQQKEQFAVTSISTATAPILQNTEITPTATIAATTTITSTTTVSVSNTQTTTATTNSSKLTVVDATNSSNTPGLSNIPNDTESISNEPVRNTDTFLAELESLKREAASNLSKETLDRTRDLRKRIEAYRTQLERILEQSTKMGSSTTATTPLLIKESTIETKETHNESSSQTTTQPIINKKIIESQKESISQPLQ